MITVPNIRVALVGACGVATDYRQGYSKIPGVEWTLAMDLNEQALQKCLAQGAKRISTQFKDSLADDIDVVDIWTPNHLHEEQACAALAAGKHVLLQKPITNTLEGADHIIAAAKKAHKTVGVYMTFYNVPLVWEVKQMIDAGAFGEIQSVRARNAYPFLRHNTLGPANWRLSKEKVGGGSFIQLSIHSLNLMQWWLGKKITEVMAYSLNQHSQGMVGGDDVTTACVRFGQDEKAPLGIFDSAYQSDDRCLEIYGTKGFIKIVRDGEIELSLGETPAPCPLVENMPGGKVLHFTRPDPINTDDFARNQHRMFFEALRAGKTPHMTAEAARHDLAVCVAAYESARQRRAIDVASL